MNKVKIETTKEITPKIYAYTTPEIKRHEGWTKIGYTEREVEQRVKEQTQTVDVEYNIEWWGISKFDGSDEIFRDTDFHLYLRKKSYKQEVGKDNEWFNIDGPTSEKEFNEYKSSKGNLVSLEAIPYHLREEQEKAVNQTLKYYEETKNGEYLWNAKPRFGKTLSVYDFCKQIGAKKVLIVTNRPTIANSWYDDYVKFMGDKSGYKFVSSTDALKAKKGEEDRYKYVISRQTFIDEFLMKDYGCIEFVSLQDLKGSKYFSATSRIDKLREVRDLEWDLLVVDEAHEGVDTYKTEVAFENIKRKFTLHLSGTPFKALAVDKFDEKAIYNWTYTDEQRSKRDWEETHKGQIDENPYGFLPKLNLFTYQMSEIIKDEVSRGIDLDGKTEEYAFDLNEFFKTDSNGIFIHDKDIDKFLDVLINNEKMPFSGEFRGELQHTFWLLYRVESARALASKLQEHPIFSKYDIILAAGDGKIDENDENEKSFNKVVKAIEDFKKSGKERGKLGTITISVGQLTTGVTIPEWTGVLMLSNMQSPAKYMQAAFRAQNPCLFQEDGKAYRKENAYVFDFDPARTLVIFDEFATNLYSNTKNGEGTEKERKERILELLNFFPVIGEDEEGKMELLDAEKVLTIPCKIKSKEVVNRGFMSDFLFRNISNVFRAPTEVIDMIQRFPAFVQPSSKIEIDEKTEKELNLNEKGEVNIDDKYVIGKSADCFGEKHYGLSKDIAKKISEVQLSHINDDSKDKEGKEIQDTITDSLVSPILKIVQDKYGKDLSSKDKGKLLNEHKEKIGRAVNKVYAQYNIDVNTLSSDRDDKVGQLDKQRKEDIGVIENKKNSDIEQANEERKNTVAAIKENEKELIKNATEDKRAEINLAKDNKKNSIDLANENKCNVINSANEKKKQEISDLTDEKRENLSALKDLLRNKGIDKSEYESRKEKIESQFEEKKQIVESKFDDKKALAEKECEDAKSRAEENYVKAKEQAENKFEESKKNIAIQSEKAQKQAEIACDKKIENANEQFKVKKEDIETVFNDNKGKVEKEFEQGKKVLSEKLVEDFKGETEKIVKSVEEDSIRKVEENIKNSQKKDKETIVKDHLRGFSRTIPSFLMAYGDKNTTLANFDKIVPPDVFKEVTDITIEDFKCLRDGVYEDKETGELKEFGFGKNRGLFDEQVFNESVQHFLMLKDKLSNYFDESQTEDIFDYIPPQQNNQIYTPKKVVKEMVKMLEENNPGCFDNDTFTFLDPYMKSGLFITEVVTKLYNSSFMKEKYPNSQERLKHIFEHQVYGIAPSKIIYDIATSFILGFDKDNVISRKNFRMVENQELITTVQEGRLEEKLTELFGE